MGFKLIYEQSVRLEANHLECLNAPNLKLNVDQLYLVQFIVMRLIHKRADTYDIYLLEIVTQIYFSQGNFFNEDSFTVNSYIPHYLYNRRVVERLYPLHIRIC